MKPILSAALLLITILPLSSAIAQPLLPITENGHFGYIDTTGRVAIAPRFHAAGSFSGGLAAAREGGLYGYIDTTGRYVIPPQFDYAEAFDTAADAARVWRAGMANAIDRSGKLLFERWYRGLSIIDEDRFVVTVMLPDSAFLADSATPQSTGMTREMLLQGTPTSIRAGLARNTTPRDSTVPAYGVIDRRGRHILDTIYRSIHFLSRHLILVSPLHPISPLSSSTSRIDDTVYARDGRTSVATGHTIRLGRFAEGRAVAYIIPPSGYVTQGVWVYIDEMGAIAQKIPETIGPVRTTPPSPFSWPPSGASPLQPFVDGRAAVLRGSGKASLLFRDGRIRDLPWKVNDILLLHGGTMLVDTAGDRWILATDKGEQILPFAFDDPEPEWGNDLIIPSGHSGYSGYARQPVTSMPPLHFVRRGLSEEREGADSVVWYAIGAHGQVLDSLVERRDPHSEFPGRSLWRMEPHEDDGLLWMSRFVDSNYAAQWWDPAAQRIVGPMPDLVDLLGTIHGVLLLHADADPFDGSEDSLVYFRRDGRPLWHTPASNDIFIPRNIDYQSVPSYWPHLPPSPIVGDAPAGTLSVRVEGKWPTPRQSGQKARTITIANATEDSLLFYGESIRFTPPRPLHFLPLLMEARDEQGIWRPIEAISPIGFRMSRGQIPSVTLPAGSALTLDLPEYDGSIETMLRLRFTYTPPGEREERIVYSNEFPGRINPGQLWR